MAINPLYSPKDYHEGRLSLLPPGKAFDEEKENEKSDTYLLLEADAKEDSRIDAHIRTLIEESDPTSTNELIEEWEESNGLSVPSASSLKERRQKVLAALLGAKASTEPPIRFIAQSFGYTIQTTIADSSQVWRFERGFDSVGNRLFNLNFNHLLIIEVFGAPKGGNPVFEAQIRAVVLAHLVVLFELCPFYFKKRNAQQTNLSDATYCAKRVRD